MTKIFKCLIVLGMIGQFFTSAAFGGFEAKITFNQIRAKAYIAELRAGADPDRLTRPQLWRSKGTKMKRSRLEILRTMDKAEALARAGKYRLIEEPKFIFNGVPEDQLKAR